MLPQAAHGMQRAGTALLERRFPLVRMLAAEAAVEQASERIEQVAPNLHKVCVQRLPAIHLCEP